MINSAKKDKPSPRRPSSQRSAIDSTLDKATLIHSGFGLPSCTVEGLDSSR